MRHLRFLIAAGLIVVLAGGCAHDKKSPSALPASSASALSVTPPAPSSGSASRETLGRAAGVSVSPAPDNPPGKLTCGRLSVAVKAATLMQPGVIDAIVSAAVTADAPVADAAQRLGVAYAAAVAASGKSNEAAATAAVSAAAADMDGVCAESGLSTVG